MADDDIPRGATAVNDELEVGFDARFEAAWSRVERMARWGLLVFVIAGLLGALGAGPLDHRSLHAPGGVVIDYQPVARFGTAMQITLHLPPDPGGRGMPVRLSGSFFEPLGVRTLTPRPLSERADGGGMEAILAGSDVAHDGLVRLDGKPSRLGMIPLTVTIADAPPANFAVFVLP